MFNCRRDNRSSNIIKGLVGGAAGLGAGLFLASKYTRNRKDQSLSSFVVNKALESMDMDEKTHIAATDKLEETIDYLWHENRKHVDNSISLEAKNHEEYIYDGMQVFVWNSDGTDDQDILVYFHGGGYVIQPSTAHFIVADILGSRTGCKVVMPIYPKAPEYTYKDAFPKLVNLYWEILNESSQDRKIHIGGDSAGGGLALAFNYYLIDKGLKQADHLILICPWLDLTNSNPELEEATGNEVFFDIEGLEMASLAWAGDDDARLSKYLSPIGGDVREIESYITLFTGTNESFVVDIKDFARILEKNNKDYSFEVGQNQHHVYPLYPTLEGSQARDKIIEEMKRINNS